MKQNKTKKIKSVVFNSRIREDLYLFLSDVIKKTDLEKRDIIEFALIDFLKKINVNMRYEDLDIKEYLQLIKIEKISRIKSLKRNSFLRENLAIANIKKDIFKLIAINKTHKTKENILFLIKKYIDIKKEEISLYQNKEELIKEIDFYMVNIQKSNLDNIYNYLNNQDELENNKKELIK